MTLPEITEELQANLGVPKEALATLGERLASANVTSAEDLLTMTQDDFDKANAGALDSMQVNSLCICLGSTNVPHKFAPAAAPEVAGARFLDECGNAKEEGEVKPEEKKVTGGSKGGTNTETAEMLQERRGHLLPGDYHVPPQFDRFAKGIPGRDMKALRKLITQEILEVCGDLYPDLAERGVILGALEDFCGPPSCGTSLHWDNYKDGDTRKKHKGTAISDLEKARAKPADYGVSRRCVPGRMRPARLKRQESVPRSAALVPPVMGEQRTINTTPLTTGQQDVGSQGGNYDLDTASVDAELSGLDAEQSLTDKVKAMQAQLEALQKKKKEEADAAKAAKAAAKVRRAAAKGNKTEAPAAEQENASSNQRKRRAPSVRTAPSVPDEDPDENPDEEGEKEEEGEGAYEGMPAEVAAAGASARRAWNVEKMEKKSASSNQRKRTAPSVPDEDPDENPDEGLPSLFGETFEQSDVANSYKVLPYSTDLFKTGQPVAAFSKETKEWVVGSISAVDVKAAIMGGEAVCCVWYTHQVLKDSKKKKAKKPPEFIMCHSDTKKEQHKTDYVFIEPKCACTFEVWPL